MHTAIVADTEEMRQHIQSRGPALEEACGGSPGVPLDGVDAAASAWAADRRCKIFGEERTPSEIRDYVTRSRHARERELGA